MIEHWTDKLETVGSNSTGGNLSLRKAFDANIIILCVRGKLAYLNRIVSSKERVVTRGLIRSKLHKQFTCPVILLNQSFPIYLKGEKEVIFLHIL